MRRLQRLTTSTIAGLVVLICLASCGYNAARSAGSTGSTSGPTGTSGSVRITKTVVGLTAGPTRISSPPTAARSSTGIVTLHLDTIPKSVRNGITLTINNQTNQEIFFADHMTECTVILLQMMTQLQENGQWQPVAPCKVLTVTRLRSQLSGKSLTVTLLPPSGQWALGLYRAVLSYVSSGVGVQSKTISSPSFRVGSKALPAPGSGSAPSSGTGP
jgi:hypothetical protein